ncbi:MAG: DUF6175 family protein [Flavobacteriales bacterium]|tara:strand:+ start:3814 stop:5211 length:1398 start_codon:yes stop_codon:yes gene_type:complete
MKLKGILTAFSLILCVLAFGQRGKKGEEGANVWEENFSAESHGQHPDAGTVSIDITNQGADLNDCISKAKQQALYVAIFKGYAKSAAGPASAPLAEKQVYNQNLDFFNKYLSSNMEGLSFVNSATTNTRKPGAKISKKVIQMTITVEITKAALQKDLESQGIIKGVADLGFKPEVLVVPGNVYMKKLGFVKKIDNQGMPQTVYNYTDAVNDEFFNSLNGFVSAKFDDAFYMADFQSKLDAINAENQKNNMRQDGLKESEFDILARVVSAELWIKLDIKEEMVSGGQEMQFTITMNALDPLTNTKVINGLPQTIKTAGDNKMQLLENTINAVADEFRPRVLKYFTERETTGMKGKIVFQISEELEVNFDTEIEVGGGKEVAFKRVISSFVGKNSISSKAAGAQTSTRLVFDVWIPTRTIDWDDSEISNSFDVFGADVKGKVKKFGYKATTDAEGLGKVIVTFTEEL